MTNGGRHLLEQCPWALAYGLRQPFEPGQAPIVGRNPREHSSNGLVLKNEVWRRYIRIINSRLIGSFNALNLLGVQALALELGFKRKISDVWKIFGGRAWTHGTNCQS